MATNHQNIRLEMVYHIMPYMAILPTLPLEESIGTYTFIELGLAFGHKRKGFNSVRDT